MSHRKNSILTTWPFLLSIILLLLNDLYLKYEFHNWFTGKLSDFSGLFLVAMIFFSIFPKNRKLTIFLLTLFFTFWKSTLSWPLITYVNSLSVIQFGRVVDYTDLVALSIFPVAILVDSHRNNYQIRLVNSFLFRIPILILVVLGVTGTSILSPQHKYEIRKSNPEQSIDIKIALNILKRVARNYHLDCVRCNPENRAGEFKGRDIFIYYNILHGDRGIEFKVEGEPGGLFWGSGSYEEMEKIKHSLQSEFGNKIPRMEFVIKLPREYEYKYNSRDESPVNTP